MQYRIEASSQDRGGREEYKCVVNTSSDEKALTIAYVLAFHNMEDRQPTVDEIKQAIAAYEENMEESFPSSKEAIIEVIEDATAESGVDLVENITTGEILYQDSVEDDSEEYSEDDIDW